MLSTAASQIDICNFALARCGVKQFITSLDPAVDSSQEAAVCALFWDVVRTKLLAGFPWKFATRVAGLEEMTASASAEEHIGTGTASLISNVVPYDTNVVGAVDVVGTYNVMLKVTTAGAVGVGALKCSIDGGITWGAPVTYADGDVVLGDAGLPVGTGTTLTGTVTVTLRADATLVVGDIYRFTVTDGLSPEYTYAYKLPVDLLLGRYLWPGSRSVRADQRVPWRRGSFGKDLDALWSDNSPDQTPTIIYVEDVTTAERFTAGFADALAWRLAYEICGPLKATVAPAELERAYLFAINEIRSIDFIEAGEDVPPDSVTIAARGYNWSPYSVGTWPPGGWFPY